MLITAFFESNFNPEVTGSLVANEKKASLSKVEFRFVKMDQQYKIKLNKSNSSPQGFLLVL